MYLLVELCAVVITLLPSPSDGAAHTGRVPGADAGHLAQPLVGLPRQLLGMPAACDPCTWQRLVVERPVWPSPPPGSLPKPPSPPNPTFDSPALGDSNDINDLTLAEHTVHRHLLLQPGLGPGHLLGHRATVQLDLHDVRLLLPEGQQLHLQDVAQPAGSGPHLLLLRGQLGTPADIPCSGLLYGLCFMLGPGAAARDEADRVPVLTELPSSWGTEAEKIPGEGQVF